MQAAENPVERGFEFDKTVKKHVLEWRDHKDSHNLGCVQVAKLEGSQRV